MRKGYSNPLIYKEINLDGEELTNGGICKYIELLITMGKITKEEIEKAQEAREDSFASIDKKTSPLIKKGYSNKEIMATDPTFLTESRVRRSRKRVIERENITKEQLEEWRKKIEQEKKDEIYQKDEK